MVAVPMSDRDLGDLDTYLLLQHPDQLGDKHEQGDDTQEDQLRQARVVHALRGRHEALEFVEPVGERHCSVSTSQL